MPTPHANDPATWEGDPDSLKGAEQRLAKDPRLCDLTFESKNEAFKVGLYLGARHPDAVINPDHVRSAVDPEGV